MDDWQQRLQHFFSAGYIRKIQSDENLYFFFNHPKEGEYIYMARPKKEEKLKHKNYITLKLTDNELACLEQSAEALNISRVEYLRNLILEKPMIYKYEVVADNEQLKKLNAEIGKIGSNLNQIAKHLNQGGVRSMILQDRVHECIDKLFDLRRQVMELAGDYYGDIEAQDK